MGTYTITVLPGDGIGPEVTEQAVRALQRVSSRYGHTFNTTQALVGVSAIEAEGDAISDPTMQLSQRSDSILFGPVGGSSRYQRPNAHIQPDHPLSRLL